MRERREIGARLAQHPSRGVAAVVGIPVPAAFAIVWYALLVPARVRCDMVALQLAATPAQAARIVGEAAGDFAVAVWWDFLVIAGYGTTLVAACALGAWGLHTRFARTAARLGVAAAIGAVVADVAENVALLVALAGDPVGGPYVLGFVASAAVAKFALVTVAVVVASASLLGIGKRALQTWLHPVESTTDRDDDFLTPRPLVRADGARFPERRLPPARPSRRTRWHHARADLPGRPPAAVGLCVSGGGIRSAALTLGALHALRDELRRARYLVSVSGGGYAAGAMQLALQPRPGETTPTADAADVFAPGSVELDHLRRHGQYIADGAREWVVALGVLARGVVMSLGLLGVTVVVAGLALARLHRAVPFFPLAGDAVIDTGHPGLVVVVAGVASAAVLWLVTLLRGPGSSGVRGAILRAAMRAALGLAALVAVFVVVVPAFAFAAEWARGQVDAPRVALPTVLATYAGALVAVLWSRRKVVSESLGPFRSWLAAHRADPGTLMSRVANGAVQYAVVWFVLVLVAGAALLALGWAVVHATTWPPLVQIGLPLGLAVVAWALDHTWVSLHPFYRRRLASAFAVRRRVLGGVGAQSDTVAEAYDFDAEGTYLATYGAPRPGFPQVIFAAAANLSGRERTPPGRRAASFTFSGDYIGGPDVGYVRTERVAAAVGPHLAADLTVQAAMAVSGAAFASAMGRQARAFQTLFAVSNARLGTWVPNPAFLSHAAGRTGDWWIPRMPRVRRLSYQLRELVGSFPLEHYLLLVTDGGHYENLGLVELLRHGCRTVYCIDASGDTPPFATTLAEAISLAREELGVDITLDEPLEIVPGSAEPLVPEDPLKALSARLSASAVVTGTITYPEPLTFDDETTGTVGRLVVAKALLTPDMPYELYAYATANPEFPRDGTGDQWFSHDQFNAYHRLGLHIGAAARAAAGAAT